jgi:hypothetical protein
MILQEPITNKNYELSGIVLDIAHHRFFKSVGIQKDEIENQFGAVLKISITFTNLNNIIKK